MHDDESLKKESPLLHSISKENPFSVPENYFDNLPSKIMERSRENVEPRRWGEGILTTILAYKWRLLTITGCMAAICFFTFRSMNSATSYEAMAKNIPDSLIVANLDKNIYSISVSSLEELSEGNYLGEEPENNSASAKVISDSAKTDQEIIAYLIDHNVSVSDIENE